MSYVKQPFHQYLCVHLPRSVDVSEIGGWSIWQRYHVRGVLIGEAQSINSLIAVIDSGPAGLTKLSVSSPCSRLGLAGLSLEIMPAKQRLIPSSRRSWEHCLFRVWNGLGLFFLMGVVGGAAFFWGIARLSESKKDV